MLDEAKFHSLMTKLDGKERGHNIINLEHETSDVCSEYDDS